MKSNKITKKLPYLIIFSIILFVLTGCSNISNSENNSSLNDQTTHAEEENNNPVFKALAAKIDE